MDELDQITERLTDALRDLPGLAAAVLFGSAAEGRLRSDSDIDVALLFAHAAIPAPFDLLDLRGVLEIAVGRDVDLIVLNDASPIIAYQALRATEPFLLRDSTAYDLYVAGLVSRYEDMKRTRRPLEEALLAPRTR